MHYTQKYLLDKIQNMEWQHNKLMMPLIKRVVVSENAVKRVRELHDGETGDCQECSKFEDGITTPFPCPTIRALDGEL